jgi:hypothetical protein
VNVTPVIIACFIIATVAWLHHAIAEHHWLHIIAHKVNPAHEIPETRHDSMWHAMGHGARMWVNAGLAAAAILLGLAWQLEQTATAVVVATGTLAWAGWMGTRAVSKALGQRHRHVPGPGPGLEED